jgi:hypothetical protein
MEMTESFFASSVDTLVGDGVDSLSVVVYIVVTRFARCATAGKRGGHEMHKGYGQKINERGDTGNRVLDEFFGYGTNQVKWFQDRTVRVFEVDKGDGRFDGVGNLILNLPIVRSTDQQMTMSQNHVHCSTCSCHGVSAFIISYQISYYQRGTFSRPKRNSAGIKSHF